MHQVPYPAGSGWSHTRFAFPHASASGLRLANEGSAAWYAFDQAHRSTLLPQSLEIGMEFLTAAAEHLMLSNAMHDRSEFRPSIELWTQAVKASVALQRQAGGRCARAGAIALTPIAITANQDLHATTRAQEESGRLV